MKVLYVSKALHVAAYRDKLRELGRHLDVAAVMPERWGALEPEPSPPGLPEPRRVRAWLHGHNHLHVYAEAAAWLDAEAPDLVHIDEEPYSLVTLQLARLCRRRRIPCLFFAWQNLRRRLPPPFGAVRAGVFERVAGGLAGTEAAARVLREDGYGGPLAVVPQFGVDPERFRPDGAARRRVRSGAGIPPDAFVVAYGGRLVPEKGVDVLLEAFARLPADGDGAAGAGEGPYLVVMGSGPEEARLGDAAARLGVGGRVRFPGQVPSTEVSGVLAAVDALVLPTLGTPTWTEQFGRILVEAMACGVPVVGSRCGEIAEVIGGAGDVVEPGDVDGLAAALDRLRGDPCLRARRSGEGRERVLERFTQARVAERTVAFYRTVRGTGAGVGVEGGRGWGCDGGGGVTGGGTTGAAARPWAPPAGWFWVGVVLLLGCAGVVFLAGAATGRLDATLLGGGAVAVAVVLLMSGGWIDPITLLVLSLPLPALYATGDLRLAPAAPLTACVVAAWVLRRAPSTKPLRLDGLPLAATAAFLGSQVIASLFAAHPAPAARELANVSLLLLLLLAAADLLNRECSRTVAVGVVLPMVAGVTGVAGVLEMVGLIPGRFPDAGELNRAALGFGQPNGLGMFLAIALPLTIHAWRTHPTRAGRLLLGAAAAGTLAGLMATFSRGSWLSVLAGSVALGLAGDWRLVLRIWGIGIVAAAGADLATGGVVREMVGGVLTDWSVAQRAALMLAGVHLFLENPVVGAGPGGFAEELERLGALVPTLWDLKPTPHNAYIQVAAESGILGLAAFLWFLHAAFHRLLDGARRAVLDPREASLCRALVWSFSVVLAQGMVGWPLSHGHGQLVMLVIALGCVLAGSRSRGAENAPSPALAGPARAGSPGATP